MTVNARGRVRRWGTRAVVVTAVAGLVAVGLPGVAQAGGPNNWTQLSKNAANGGYPKMNTIDEPTLLRAGSSLQVAWRGENDSDTDSYKTAIVSSAGATTTPDTTILTWAGLNDAPDLAWIGQQRWLAFGGQRTTDSADPLSTGQGYYLTSTDGISWTLGDGTLSGSGAYATQGLGIVDDGGEPLWVSNQGRTVDGVAQTGLGYHRGVDPRPVIPGGEPDPFVGVPGCCAYDAAVARDETSGAAYGAWYSNATGAKGIYVAQVAPTVGSPQLAPSSRTGANSNDPSQRVAIAARTGGGVYLAYKVGYPTTAYLALWRVGSSSVVKVPGSKNAEFVSLSAGPGGRLWVSWVDRSGKDAVKAARTNTGATRFGSVRTLAAPNLDPVWHQAANGANGPLDVVVTGSRGQAINVWHTQVLPALTVQVKPSKAARGKTVTFSVTDAGAPVAGAKVKVFGKTLTTSSAGKAKVKVPLSAAKKKYPVVVTKSGYALAKASVRVV